MNDKDATRNLALLLSELSGKKEQQQQQSEEKTNNTTNNKLFLNDMKQPNFDKPLYNEQLVPITIHLSLDDYEINDSFVWNLKENTITPEDFAQTFIDDLVLPQKFKALIADSIREQLQTFEKLFEKDHTSDEHSMMIIDPLIDDNLNEKVGINDADVDDNDNDDNDDIDEKDYDSFPPPPPTYEQKKECLCIIQLNISINNITIQDQFEWDLNADESSNSPELFARVLCTDLALSREFQVAIAHSIREQLLAYRKQLLEKSKGSISSPSYGKEYSDIYLSRPPVVSALRVLEESEHWTPLVGPSDKLNEIISARLLSHGRSDTKYRLRSLVPRSSSRINKIL